MNLDCYSAGAATTLKNCVLNVVAVPQAAVWTGGAGYLVSCILQVQVTR